MPAQSPTLSPTLSAMVAGLRGSSSGMPASTLPTRSPPTSAPLVKMPPPRRAKIEISDAPKPSATSASTTMRSDLNPGLDLADEIAADVGALGEDAAAQTREDRNQRCAKAERHQRIDHDAVVRGEIEDARAGGERDGGAQQRA